MHTANADAIHTGRMIDVGLVEPAAARKAIIVDGISWNEVVLRVTSIHILPDGFSGFGFSSSSVCAASIPIGVAAFPIPSIFAVIFIEIYRRAVSELLGKSLVTTGAIKRQIRFDTPLFSEIFIMPVQKHIAPANDISVETAVDAPSKTAFIVSSMRPVMTAVIIDTITIKLHIKFIHTTSLDGMYLHLCICKNNFKFWNKKGDFLLKNNCNSV